MSPRAMKTNMFPPIPPTKYKTLSRFVETAHWIRTRTLLIKTIMYPL
jgi:hypothetical protein